MRGEELQGKGDQIHMNVDGSSWNLCENRAFQDSNRLEVVALDKIYGMRRKRRRRDLCNVVRKTTTSIIWHETSLNRGLHVWLIVNSPESLAH